MATMTSLANVKDSRWLQLEVCREFQRNKCTRPDTECKFAHPASNVEVQNGRVIACYDSIKGRCNREKPPCKYFHPPQHLKDQLLINGRNHLALKNALLQQMPMQMPMQTGQPGGAATMAGNPYMPTLMASPYLTGLIPGMMATTGGEPTLMTPTTLISPQRRTDRLEDQTSLQQNTDNSGLTQATIPGIVQYRRPALEKSGMPVYQPSASAAAAAAYQQAALALQMQQQFAVPVSYLRYPGDVYRFS